MPRPTAGILLILTLGAPPGLKAQEGAVLSRLAGVRCERTAEGVAGLLIRRVAAAIGMDRPAALRVESQGTTAQPYQSDRTYPPFFDLHWTTRSWFDPAGGGLHIQQQGGAFPGGTFGASRFPTISHTFAQWVWRDTTWLAAPDFSQGAPSRSLHPWAVVYDFLSDSSARAVGRCRFRDYDRVALEHTGPFGPERLLLDPKTWVPVALVREEPHYLWGQVDVAYVWSIWDLIRGEGGGLYPLTAFRVVDGDVDMRQTVTAHARATEDSVPSLNVPDPTLRLDGRIASFHQPLPPDTVRVGPSAWLLRNPSYTTGAVLARDTVFLLDATLSDARARQDSQWVAGLFPGSHPVVLIVTDLAWPHIGGVRYWAAKGATIVTHRAAVAFLDSVFARRWTREPDAFERARGTVRPAIRTVDDSLLLAGGDLRVYPIDGVASEVALMVWLPAERFLWPGDYIQTLRAPSMYAAEVATAVRRVGLAPTRFAAQHVPLAAWRTVDSLVPDPHGGGLDPATVDGRSLRLGRTVSWTTSVRDGVRTDQAESAEEVVPLRVGGWDALAIVWSRATPQGVAVDSAIVDRATFRPIRHVNVAPTRTMVLEFDGARVRGRFDVAGASSLPIDQSFATEVYDSSIMDRMLSTLPLHEGYRTRVPFYIYELGGLVWYDVRVTGMERATRHDGSRTSAWVVELARDGVLRSRAWVARTGPRDVVRMIQYITPMFSLERTR